MQRFENLQKQLEMKREKKKLEIMKKEEIMHLKKLDQIDSMQDQKRTRSHTKDFIERKHQFLAEQLEQVKLGKKYIEEARIK